MPLIRCDYDSTVISDEKLNELIDYILTESMRIFDTDEDHISIFCAPYAPQARSTAAAEIEWRAGAKEFVDENRSVEDVLIDFLAQIKESVATKKKDLGIENGIIASLTIENWKVEWIA